MKIHPDHHLALDTNILIYALDKTSPFHPLTTQTLTFLYKSGTPLFVTQQNLLETHRVLIGIYKLPRKQVIEKVNQLITSLKISLISPLPTLLKAPVFKPGKFICNISATYSGVKAFVLNIAKYYQTKTKVI